MPLYPLFADLDQREVLVVGGGEVATRKVDALLRAGACVRVCAPDLSPQLAGWCADGRVRHRATPFDPAWLDDAWLVLAATDDSAFNAALAREATARKRLINVVDDAALSTFQVPVVIDRDPLQVAISSSGAAPMLARRLGRQLEAWIEPAWGSLAALFARHRGAIRRRFPDLAERRHWYDARIDGEVMALLRHGDAAAAEQALRIALQAADTAASCGSITLVSLPDGRPEHLTLHALRAMHRADHVVVAAGMAEGVVALARRDASRVRMAAFDDAGARTLGELAMAGKQVVVVWPDPSPVAALADAAGDVLLDLVECNGRARQVSQGKSGQLTRSW